MPSPKKKKTEAQHTPGPWKLQPGRHDKMHGEIWGPLGCELNEPVAEIPEDDVTTKGMRQVKANARLIAAAPDLLAALEGILRDHERDGCEPAHHCERCRPARAAIRRARGGA